MLSPEPDTLPPSADETAPAPAALRELGPFEPPADYAFEPEFRNAAPRTIPPELRQGRYARRQRRTAWGFLVAGLLCIGLGLLPIVQFWGLFVLPLQYLQWIGVGCVVIGGIALAQYLLRPGPFRYVEEGGPLIARIRDMALVPGPLYNGQPTNYHFAALIEHPDPETGQLVVTETKSNDISTGQKGELTTSFRVGDYVTAVYLPSDPHQSLRLYGFLDLRPDLGLVRRDAAREAGLAMTLGVIVALFGFFGVLAWNIYAFGAYQPLELTFAQGAVPFTIGAVLLGGAFLGLIFGQALYERRKREARNAEAAARGEAVELDHSGGAGFAGYGIVLGVILLLGGLGLGGATALCWAFTANALLDDSPPELRPVQITDMIMTTHSFLFREYTIKYRLPGSEETLSLLTTPEHMDQFENPLGLAEVHRGWFGWPWIRTIRPVRLNGPADGP